MSDGDKRIILRQRLSGADLIKADEQHGMVSIQDRRQIPKPLTSTWDLPKSEWPDLSSEVTPEAIDVALVLAFFDEVPMQVLRSSSWHYLHHQCAGVCCFHETMVAVPLQPQPNVRAAFIEIARRNWGSDLGRGTPLLSEITEYRNALLPLGLDCNWAYKRLKEAIYPVDSSQEALERAAVNAPNLAALTGDRWYTSTICFLSPNSD